MNEILSIDVEVDWLDGLDEPSGLIWTGDCWSLADRPVETAFQCYEDASGLGIKGFSTRPKGYDLQQVFNLDEVGRVALLAQRARAGDLNEGFAS